MHKLNNARKINIFFEIFSCFIKIMSTVEYHKQYHVLSKRQVENTYFY